MRFRLAVLALFTSTNLLCGNAAHADTEVFHSASPDLTVKLEPQHFVEASASLTAKMSKEPLVYPVNRYEVTIPLLARGYTENMSAQISVRNIQVVPAADRLLLTVDFERILVDIGHLRLESYFLPGLGSSCTGAYLDLGRQGRLRALATVKPTVVGGSIVARLERFQFQMPETYRSQGPTDCRGGFIIGDLFTQIIAGEVLAHAHGFIEDAVSREAVRIVKTVEGMLNEIAAMQLPLTIPQLVVLPPSHAAVQLFPMGVVVTAAGATMTAGVRISTLDSAPATPPTEPRLAENALAVMSTTETFVNEVVRTLFAAGRFNFEATAEQHPLFAAFKDPLQMENFLPDLVTVERDVGSDLRLFVEPEVAPVVQLSAGVVGLSSAKTKMRFQIKQNGEWRDYFHMQVQIAFGLKPTEGATGIQLGVVAGSAAVTGEWPSAPANPAFDAEGMAAFFSALMQVLERTGAPFVVTRPTLPVAGFDLAPRGITLTEDQVSVDVVETR